MDSHSLNPSSQQRSGGSQVHLNPTGPKKSQKKKFSQISAVQKCNWKPSNYLNSPFKPRSRITKSDAGKLIQKLIISNKLLMAIYRHLKLNQVTVLSFHKNIKPKIKLSLLSNLKISSKPKYQSKISEQQQQQKNK